MKKTFLILLILLSGCQSDSYAKFLGYETYSEELDNYYRVINENDNITLIEVRNDTKVITEEYVSYYIMETPEEFCNVALQIPNPNDPENPIEVPLPCYSKLHVNLKEKNARCTYFILKNGNIYSMGEFGNIATEEDIRTLFSVIEDVEFFNYRQE